MTHQKFKEFENKLLEEVARTVDTNGEIYSSSVERFSDFTECGFELGIARYQAAWVHFKKHYNALVKRVKLGKPSSSVRSRIIDMIGYLILIAAMIEEEDSYNV